MVETQITEILASQGVDENLEFREKFIRVGYWRRLTDDQYHAISHIVYEDCYEDDDGDDVKGRPIIRKLYSYYYKNII